MDLYEHVLISYVERARLALAHLESARNTSAFPSLFLWNLQNEAHLCCSMSANNRFQHSQSVLAGTCNSFHAVAKAGFDFCRGVRRIAKFLRERFELRVPLCRKLGLRRKAMGCPSSRERRRQSAVPSRRHPSGSSCPGSPRSLLVPVLHRARERKPTGEDVPAPTPALWLLALVSFPVAQLVADSFAFTLLPFVGSERPCDERLTRLRRLLA